MTSALPDVGGDAALHSLEPLLPAHRMAARERHFARLAAAFGAKRAGDAVVRARPRSCWSCAGACVDRTPHVLATVGGRGELHPCADVDIAVIASTEIDGDDRERLGQ